jgi:CubicO group peptidase (beta-lactamase class C family)
VAPAAGLAGSAADLVAFGRLHLGDAGWLLDPELAAEMRRPASEHAPFGLADAWGLGWGLFGPDHCLGLDAAGAGTTCNLRVHPSGTVVALTTNSAAGFSVWQDLVEVLWADGIAVRGAPMALAAEPGAARPFEGRTGTWRNGELTYEITAGGTLADDDGVTYQLTEHDHQIFAAVPAGQPDTRYWGRFLAEDAELMQFAGRVLRKQTDVGAGT